MGPGSSDSAWGSSCYRWDPIGSSLPNLKANSQEVGSDDKQAATRAVAFVVQNSREGIVHLCAEVANLMKAKKRLEQLVQSLERENADLKKRRPCEKKDELVDHSRSLPCPRDPCHSSSKRLQNRSLRCTKLGPESPPLLSAITPHGDNVSAMDSVHMEDFSDSYLHGRTKNGSLRCEREPASTSMSSSTEEIHWVPSSSTTLNSTLPSSSPSSGRPKKRSLGCAKGVTMPEIEGRDLVTQDYILPEEATVNSLPKEIEPRAGRNCGSLHAVTVEVHQSNHDSVSSVPADGCSGVPADGCSSMLNSVAVGTVPHSAKSIGIQCSIGHSVLCRLESTLERVEREKIDLQSERAKLQEEVDALNRELNKLKNTRKVCKEPATEPEDRLAAEDGRTHTRSILEDKGPSWSLPSLVTPGEIGGTPVKSLQKITARCIIHLGDRVLTKSDLKGWVRYLGTLKHLNSSAMFAGLHCETPVGSHNGFFRKYQYFRCPPNCGIFVPVQDVLKVLTSRFNMKPRSALSSLSNKVSPSGTPLIKAPSRGMSDEVWLLSTTRSKNGSM